MLNYRRNRSPFRLGKQATRFVMKCVLLPLVPNVSGRVVFEAWGLHSYLMSKSSRNLHGLVRKVDPHSRSQDQNPMKSLQDNNNAKPHGCWLF